MLGHGVMALSKLSRHKTVRGRTFVVAVDGSKLSKRAARLAAYMLGPFDKIKVVHVEVKEDDEGWRTIKNNFEHDLQQTCGVPRSKVTVEKVPIKPGDDLKSTLIRLANSDTHQVLVMGSAGSRHELQDAESKKKRPIGEAPMGSIAEMMMNAVKVPVILVKAKALSQLESEDSLARRKVGYKDVGVHILAAVDGGRLSQKCFDFAAHISKQGDTVSVLHVTDSDHAVKRSHAGGNELMGDSAVRTYYTEECNKASLARPDIEFKFVDRHKKGTVRDTVLAFTESEPLVDFVILGSVELLRQHEKHGTVMGSVSSAVAHHSAAHPIIIKPEAQY